MPLSRRDFLLTAGAVAFEASCTSALPPALCSARPAGSCPPPTPLAITLPGERMELFAYDEMHRATPMVYSPRSSAEIGTLLKSVPAGRHVTFRGGGQSMDSQSLNEDIVVSIDAANFGKIGDPVQDDDGFHITTGAAARWWDILAKISPLGLVPLSVVTAGNATVGGTMSADCLSRQSPIVGKEGNQVRSFTIVLADGRVLTCKKNDSDPEKNALFNSVIGGFGYLGAVTEVTFDLLVARSNPGVAGSPPRVLTRSTRHDANVDWDTALRELHLKSNTGHKHFKDNRRLHVGGRSTAGAAGGVASHAHAPEWSGLSLVSFLTGSGMAANLLEQRFVEDQTLRPVPGGVYDKDAAFPANAEKLSPHFQTFVDLALDLGFPEGEFVDELFGWTFFLGNSTKRAKDDFHASGQRLNFTQQSFTLPAVNEKGAIDTRPVCRFLEFVEARIHGANLSPATIDFLYIPGDDFLMSASRNLPGFVVTIAFVLANQTSLTSDIRDTLTTLTRDCRTLGGRVHLVKGVVAERGDLRAMHGDAAAELRRLKAHFDPQGIFHNEFFARVFEA